ncbi:glutathione S-transferase 1-like [Bradysia coprophila]|uniref:glutathione S-transferase 1-like n=1 Tax=Bradysia coprophila TaxID=38358 RepID=UPI00187DB0A2|nr:glutathione S-transferase 1-like [Bradysia coprophila]
MSKITLYYTITSPPSRGVILASKALGVDLQLKNVDMSKGEHLTPEFLQLNPQHTVPVINDNGVIVFESHAIVAYLWEKYANESSLYSFDNFQRARINALLHFDTGYLFRHFDHLYYEIYDYGATDVPQKTVKNLKKCWAIMENFLANGNFLCGNEMCIADISCIATLTSVDSFSPIDSATYPKLVEWVKTMKALPFYEHNKNGAELVQKIMWEKMEANKTAAK